MADLSTFLASGGSGKQYKIKSLQGVFLNGGTTGVSGGTATVGATEFAVVKFIDLNVDCGIITTAFAGGNTIAAGTVNTESRLALENADIVGGLGENVTITKTAGDPSSNYGFIAIYEEA